MGRLVLLQAAIVVHADAVDETHPNTTAVRSRTPHAFQKTRPMMGHKGKRWDFIETIYSFLVAQQMVDVVGPRSKIQESANSFPILLSFFMTARDISWNLIAPMRLLAIVVR